MTAASIRPRTLLFPLLLAVLLAPGGPARAGTSTTDSVRTPEDLLMKAYSFEGLPAGVVLAFPFASTPGEDGDWLECDGSAVDAAEHADLSTLVDGTLPDYRGLFLRTLGGNSAALGAFQGEALAAHAHGATAASLGTLFLPDAGTLSGSIASSGIADEVTLEVPTLSLVTGGEEGASTTTTTGTTGGDETRPENVAVRWFAHAAQ